MSGCEEQLLTRAEVLEDVGELVQALDPGAETSYDAGSKEERHPGTGYRSDGECLEAVSQAGDDVHDRLREVQQLQEVIVTAMDAAQAALDAAYAMPVKDECDGCHGAKEAAIMAALSRIRMCETAAEILDPLMERLRTALARLRQAPEDLGEVYQLVYEFIRKGGKLPVYARWIEGGC